MADQLYGYGQAAAPRQAAATALLDAVQAVTALDQQLHRHPLARAWARAERELAVAAAAGAANPGSTDFELVLRARLGVGLLPAGHVALSDLDARARAWEMVRQRKGAAELRALVGALVPARGTRDLVGLADGIAAVLATVAVTSWEVRRDGEGAGTLVVAPGGSIDRGDVALAVPYALRRLGLTRTVLPALSGRVRTLQVGVTEGGPREDEDPLAPLTRWAATLAEQARAGAARLHRLERYARHVEEQLILVRRPQALRRLAGVGLSSWGLWAAQLARVTNVELSSAWRTLGQGAELGIVEAVPRGSGADGAAARRSRGDGTVYAIPPWLQLAGLSAAPRGRPRLTAGTSGAGGSAAMPAVNRDDGFAAVGAAMDDTAAAIADLEALLARTSQA